MTTLSQIAEVQSIVREAIGYEATVAGGAVRDLRLGRPIKDIDVFIVRSREADVYEEAEQRYYAKKAAKALLATDFRITSESGYPDGEQVYATYEADTSYGLVNLIFVQEFGPAMNEFPDTLAQAHLDDDGVPLYSDEFERSVAEKLVYHRLADDTKRLPRMLSKFPEFVWEHVDQGAGSEVLEWK